MIKNMNKKYATAKRPGLVFEQMDALNTTYDNEQFNVVLDKGTLDALMPDNKEDTVEKINKLFAVSSFWFNLLCLMDCISSLFLFFPSNF